MPTASQLPWRPGPQLSSPDIAAAVIGHRGAAARAPENTLAGLALARKLGCRWVEFDVRLSRDGVPVLLHDETLERTTSGRGRLCDFDAAELQTLDAGSWFAASFAGERIPTLAQAVALLVELGLGANVEIKACAGREAEAGERVARELQHLWPADRPPPLLSSFSEAALAAAMRAAPDIPRGLLRERLGADWRLRMTALGCVTLHLNHRWVSRHQLAALRDAGVPVLLYTVNEPERATELLEAGAAAVFSDVPDLIFAALGCVQ